MTDTYTQESAVAVYSTPRLVTPLLREYEPDFVLFFFKQHSGARRTTRSVVRSASCAVLKRAFFTGCPAAINLAQRLDRDLGAVSRL